MDISQQFLQVTFKTGSFLIAWSWALVYYGVSHALVEESPLKQQIGFGGAGQPRSLLMLLCQYLAVCSAAAPLLQRLKGSPSRYAATLAASVEFFPSPIFAGALTAYISQFSGGLRLCVLNLLATWAVAAMVSVAVSSGSLCGFGDIVTKTVGFGLGVAWNSLASQFEPLSSHLFVRTLYLGFMLVLAASLAVPELEDISLRQRHASLLSFASRVVCAFALSDWLSIVMPEGQLGNAYSLLSLLVLAAVLSAIVLQSDLDRPSDSMGERSSSGGVLNRAVNCLVFIPCVWCCCPCVPLFWLLSGARVGVKSRWLSLTSDVVSLAASIVGTNIITSFLDTSAANFGICSGEECNVLAFLFYTVLAAVVVSLTMLAVIAPLSEPWTPPSDGYVVLLEGA